MISYKDALAKVLTCTKSLGSEKIKLTDAGGRFLAETVYADRDFPPFDRVTMDGIGVVFSALQSEETVYKIETIAKAGAPQVTLSRSDNCIEVTTGAMLPKGCDTVIPYEHLLKVGEGYQIKTKPKLGQNIHSKGSDAQNQNPLLLKGSPIFAPEIAILATIGKAEVPVLKSPSVTIVSTGDELVPVSAIPQPHQIRMSNTFMLYEALRQWQIKPQLLHIPDDKVALHDALSKALNLSDVLIISGGVSMGKFDFLPEILDQLEVKKLFHRVAQKPGKPIWFGTWNAGNCAVFSLPGNPVSSFLNYLVYFQAWLRSCWDLPLTQNHVKTSVIQTNASILTQFVPVRLEAIEGLYHAVPIGNNGSGDFLSLSQSDGFIVLEPESEYEMNSILPYIPFRSLYR